MAARLSLGVTVALPAVVPLQSVNNAIFDPLFERPAATSQTGPSGP